MGLILVEGSVAVGKTFFTEQIKNYLPESYEKLFVVSEPIDCWRNYRGNNLLGLFNENPKVNCFNFELLAMRTMTDTHNVSLEGETLLMERSLFSAYEVFVRTQRRLGYLNDIQFNLLGDYFLLMESTLAQKEPDLIFYLTASPEALLERVRARGRAEELSVITLDYLEELGRSYDSYIKFMEMKGIPTIRITTENDVEVMIESFRCHFHRIRKLVEDK